MYFVRGLGKILTLPRIIHTGYIFRGAHSRSVNCIPGRCSSRGSQRSAIEHIRAATTATLRMVHVSTGLVHLLVHTTGEDERSEGVKVCQDDNSMYNFSQRPAIITLCQFLKDNNSLLYLLLSFLYYTSTNNYNE